MKKILWIFSCTLLLSVAFFSTGCGDDPVVVDDLAPIVSITDGPTPAAVVAGAGSIATVTVEATKGTKALKAVTVYEGSTKVSLDDLEIDGVAASANPVLITSPTDVMTWEIGVHVHASAGTATYRVVVEDEGGLSDEASFDVTVETALTQSLTGVLFNSAGPAGTGGLDLDSGDGTGSSNAAAEIRDMGIDSMSTNEATEWRQRIGGINGSEVRFVGTNGVDSDFDAIASKEAVVGAFDGGLDFVAASTIADGNIDVWGNFKVSKTLEVGDIFAVLNGGTYYLVLVEDVVVEPATNNNNDHYTMAIKY
jgi:hypothetical protein